MSQSAAILRVHPTDNVAVALRDLSPGQRCSADGASVVAAEAIVTGHKIALVAIAAGETVVKYGQPIGHATADIAPGEHVHTHTMATNLTKAGSDTCRPVQSFWEPGESEPLTFDGYVRGDGRVGIRNEVWIVPTVGCVNRVAEALAREAQGRIADSAVDDILALTHPLGCSQLGEDHRRTQRVLAGLVSHPNAGAVLVLGLGCENNNIPAFQDVLGATDPERVAFLNAQDVDDEIAAGGKLLDRLIAHAAKATREPVDVAALHVGLKCGGSDGLSGVTANPLVGAVCDRLVAAGGSAILTEVPEMFGAEALLQGRCDRAEVFTKCRAMIDDFKAYFTRHGQPIDKNPSPGNLAGGITTLEEKSLGCVQKAGSAPIVDVLTYGERATRPGVSLLDGPGNDMIAVTNLAAAGAQLILFTTGRGTPLGAPVPTVKIATNTPLARRKPHWIDFDAGAMIEGRPMDELAQTLLQQVLDIASGRVLTTNERHGWRDVAIFSDGVTL